MFPIIALMKKDVLTTLRAPRFALISVLVPVAFTILYAIVIHVSTTASVVVANDDASVEAEQFIEIMREMHNQDGYYYEIITTDPRNAREMYSSARSGAMIVIPAGFGEGINNNLEPEIHLSLFNINADATKNHHLRLVEAINIFSREIGMEPSVIFEERQLFRSDIPITLYLGCALIIFAVLYAGMVNGGTLIAQEWEERTAKSLVMSPKAPLALIAGKWLAGGAISLITIVVAIISISLVLGFPVTQFGWRSACAMLVVWIYGAAFGSLLATIFRRSLPLIPIAVVVAIFHFLVSGYESYIRGFAHGGIVEWLWLGTEWIPLATLIDAIRFDAADFGPPPGFTAAIFWCLALAFTLSILAVHRVTRSIYVSQGQ